MTGPGSSWTSDYGIAIGDFGFGTLIIEKGGKVNAPTGTFLAVRDGSSGVAEVTGMNSVLETSDILLVGQYGTASLAITHGGAVNNTGMTKVSALGTVQVDGVGSKLSTGTDMTLDGSLDITNGGVVSVGASSSIGNSTNFAGGVNVSGAGSQWTTTGVLTVGDAGSGTLNISNGGVVNSQATILAVTDDVASTININEGGTFNTDLLTFSDGDGTLNFDSKADYAFATAMEGYGNLNVLSGHVILSGDSGAFNGKTQVFDKSILSVNGVLGGTLDVLGGGVLGGIGTVGSTTIEDLAILAPGNSMGTIHVNGDLTFSPGSTYLVETSADGTSDKSEVSGTASLNGARVQVEADSGNGQPTTTYTILTSTGGVSGLFSGVTANLAFLKPVIGYPDANTVILSLEVPVDEKNPDRTIAQLQGKIYPSLAGVLLEDSRFINEAVNNRMRSAFGVSSVPVPVLAFGPEGAELQAATTDRFALWAQGFGSWEDKKSDEAFAGLDRSIGGVFAGGDAAIGDHVRLGLVGGYGHTKLDEPDLAASASVDSYYLDVYGGAELGAVKLRSGASYTRHDIGIERQVQFTDTREYLGADYHAGTAQAFGEIGYNIRAASVDLEPFANLAYANLRSASFAETGGTAALSGGASTNDVTYSTLGLRASTELSLGFADATLRGTAAWRHAYGDITPVSSNAFAGAGTFDVSGLPIARDTALLEAGFDMDVAKNTTIGLVYQGQIASKVQDHGFKANLNVRF
ncbi:autotransporter domain-containing protein [Phyllobacterium zundukense]|uniref:autotransporter family protein n=1 Tax=Phyllobacterium zundukense TaxID=1867719 RepID=UPI001F1E6F5A|nr:autotransporter domain-containing protein [Phyllobacterium zundukense]